MGAIVSKRGETARRIYAVLKRTPDLTSKEVAERLPDLTSAAVSAALHKLKKNGALGVRNRKLVRTAGRGPHTADTYHVKYKSGAVPAAPKVEKLKAVAAPVSKAFEEAYQRLAMLHTETMAELVEEKKKVHLCDSWWCRFKRKFA